MKTEGGSLGYVKAEKSAPKEPPRAPNKADGEPAPDASTREDGDARERAAEEEEARREKQWRGRFRDMHSRIDRLQRMIDADKKALADPVNSGIPVLYDARGAIVPNPEFEAIRRRIPEQEAQLRQAKDELADLEREASRNAVPQIWRH